MSDEERKEKARKKMPSQPQMTDFLKNKVLTTAQITEMRRLNLEVTTSTNIPLGFFNKPAMKKRDEELLKMCGYSGEMAAKFDKTAETVKKDAFAESKDNKNLIRRIAEKLVQEGRIAIAIDYKSILNQKGDEEPDALGTAIIVTMDNFERFIYPLDYVPSSAKDKETTVALARQTLEEYDLWQYVQEGKISFVCDAGLVSAVKLLAPNCMVEICNFHTIGRILANTLDKNLLEYNKGAKSKIEEINKFFQFCKNGFSKKELSRLPSGSAKSINSWTLDHVLTDEDRSNIGKYQNPKGWKVEWNFDELKEEDIEPRSKFVRKFKKIPTVSKPKDIRPRTMKPALDALMILKPHLMAAKDDQSHPLHEHAQNLPDFDLIEAQQIVCAQLEPFISFFERDDNQQVGEYFTIVTHLCKWAGSPQQDNGRLSRHIQNHKERF